MSHENQCIRMGFLSEVNCETCGLAKKCVQDCLEQLKTMECCGNCDEYCKEEDVIDENCHVMHGLFNPWHKCDKWKIRNESS